MGRSKDELFQIAIGARASLDEIKLDDMSVLFVISEREDIQRRTVVQISKEDAINLVKFIVGIEEKQ